MRRNTLLCTNLIISAAESETGILENDHPVMEQEWSTIIYHLQLLHQGGYIVVHESDPAEWRRYEPEQVAWGLTMKGWDYYLISQHDAFPFFHDRLMAILGGVPMDLLYKLVCGQMLAESGMEGVHV